MSNNRNEKESWERDTLRMKPVRAERSDTNPGHQPAPSRSSGRNPETSFYAEDDGNGKAKLVIGIIAAIIVVLSLALMYLDMVEKNAADTDAGDAPVYEDTIEYEENRSETDNGDSVTEDETQEEEKTNDEKQQTEEEATGNSETESVEPEKEEQPDASEPVDDDTSETLTPDSEPSPEPEASEGESTTTPVVETSASNTQPE